MTGLAKEVLQMSVTASGVVLAVLLIRFCFGRLPKIYSYLLWGIVLIRFLCPFYIKTSVSLVTPVELGQPSMRILGPEEAMILFPVSGRFSLWAVVWITGMLVFLVMHVISYRRLGKSLAMAVRVEDGVYETDQITGAFVMGGWHPRIYLQAGIGEEERKAILCHERIHIRRKDHLVKLLAYGVLMVHWFNPLAWISLWLMCEDMEMACDETAVEQMDAETYSMALLSMAARRSGLRLPLAFGESHTKSRIRNILRCRKPHIWLGAGAVLVLGMAAVVLLTDSSTASRAVSIIGGADGPTSIFLAGKLGSGEQPGDLVVKTVRKNYTSLESIPDTLYYEEYIEDAWWAGELSCTGRPAEPSAAGLYEVEFFGTLTKTE